MWRFLILAFSILFFSATSTRADRVVVSVGHGHHHGYHRGHWHFVYNHYWHHRRWGHVYLEPEYTVYLNPLPYSGPGYQIVTVYFDDGSQLNNVYVYNHDQIEVPPAYSGRKVTRIEVEK